MGLRYRLDVSTLPGRPDIVLAKHRLVVFCDGDFWHGRNLDARLAKLAGGHNAAYWVKKISSNVARDRGHDASLRAAGWRVIRLWEGDILRDSEGAAMRVVDATRAGGAT
jgi:DNA mismatch endonuclease, patch repair protein